MIIRKIKIRELQDFINSQEYKDLPFVPISHERAISYINNPRADKDDVAIIMLYKDNNLAAYRTIFADKIISGEKSIKFFRLSGNFVLPEYRRNSFSTILLQECFKCSNDLLSNSNTSPSSKSVYDKSGMFQELICHSGIRFYTRSILSKLLPEKKEFFKKTLFALKQVDRFVNFIAKKRISKISVAKFENYEIIRKFENDFFKDFKDFDKNLYKRSEAEFNWILNFPWLNTKKKNEKYNFSSYASFFIYYPIILKDNSGKKSSFFLIKIRDKNLSIPYVYCNNIQDYKQIISIIVQLSVVHEIEYITIYNNLLISELSKIKKLYLYSKEMKESFFVSQELKKLIENKEFTVQIGDDDSVFT